MQSNHSVFLQPAQPVPIVLKAPFLQRRFLKQIAKCAVFICETSSELRGVCTLHIHLPPFNGRPIKPLLRGQRRLKRAAFQNTAAMRRKKHPPGWKMRIANARAKIFRYP